jgi:hypothetical protein
MDDVMFGFPWTEDTPDNKKPILWIRGMAAFITVYVHLFLFSHGILE